MVSKGHDPRYQRLVDGLLLPADVAGDPALDFCNTRAGWNSTEPREYLTSYDHLAVWAREAGLAEAHVVDRLRRRAAREPAAARRALERGLALRDALYASCLDARAPEWDVVARAAHEAAAAAVLVRGNGWVFPESVGVDLPNLSVARAAGELLATARAEAVGVCPGKDCGWLFLDVRGRRRWCTMSVCGNREKARRHARRERG